MIGERHKRASIEFVQEPSTIVKIGKKKWNGSNHSNGWNRSMVGQSVPKRIQKLLHVHMDHSLSIWNIRLNFWEIVQLEMRLMMCWWMSRFQYKGNLILRKVTGEPLMQRKDDTAAVLKSRKTVNIKENRPVSFTYEVAFVESDIKWPSRWDAY
ncbi:putative adenylate kinase [Helianthus annuus]|uniref:Adenylate kinase n=1 Tax=Helianthus annuus TaxID=4232 RepID=A0A9K3NNI1_HELAN|nr:putative adenylate kinase [Helianthus annuus]KAJ0731030.1 putative adenylate kinase [Helianthus annuus]KAJ0892646.1 putative adenylate kinase [Helianthus annuus]KAJ0904435.1 putative adenylate kinase [Helianthus annuus]KAJ0907684.1 putative adenylate kinase [Helianthus annuus]